MRLTEAVLRAVTLLGGVIGVVSILLLMVLTVVTVAARAVGIAFPGTYQIAELLLIPAVSFSLAYAGYAGAHTRLDLVVERLPERARKVVNAAVTALGTVFWMLVTYAIARETARSFDQGELSPILDVPVAPIRVLMVAALVLFCAILLVQVVRSARGLKEPGASAGDYQ